MATTYKELYKNINKKFGDIIDQTLTGDNASKHASIQAFYDDYKKWININANNNEKVIYEEAISEYRTMLLFLCMGLYKNAYMSLRGYFELTLFGIMVSASDFEFRLWKRGLKDIHWSEINNMDKGIFSKVFLETYNPELSEYAADMQDLAREMYRSCSEYIHSGYSIIDNDSDISFNQDMFLSFCDRVNSINRIITYAFCIRYADELTNSEVKEQMQESLLEQLADIKPIHNMYS